MRRVRAPRVWTIVGLLAAALMGACAGEPEQQAPASPGVDELIVQAANYDLVAGEESRFIAGLLTADQRFVSFGEVDVRFSYLGTAEEPVDEEGPQASARFLAIEGNEDHAEDGPESTTAMEGRGVYAADVTFDRPGFWSAEVRAEMADGIGSGTANFEVFDENRYPAVGENAPLTDNLTVDTDDAPRAAIDSRARDGERIPDPRLHQMTIAESIRAREPALVVFATPVYCVSRFCGPVTDMAADLEKEYGDRVNVIHVEVWRNFQGGVVNKGAAEWIYRDDDLTEPWVYFVDAKGRIAARWDNVATRAEIEPWLKELPRLSS